MSLYTCQDIPTVIYKTKTVIYKTKQLVTMEKTFIRIKMLKRFGEFKDLPECLTVGIIRETEKAILVSWDSNIWIPKSCFQLIRIL